MSSFTESVVEQAALVWLEGLGYEIVYGPNIAPGEPQAQRDTAYDVLLEIRLRDAVGRLNPDLPQSALDEAVRQISHAHSGSLLQANRAFHKMLVRGVEVEFLHDEQVDNDLVKLLDFDHPENNDWLVVNQFTVRQGRYERRPDIVVFVNGLPLAVIELKNSADENADIWKAWQQLQTYQNQIPNLFIYNEVQVISDGVHSRMGTVLTGRERFMPWRTVDGGELAPLGQNTLEVLILGVFEQQRFLELIRDFVVFEEDGAKIEKKIAAYHQFFAVRKALERTVEASVPGGSRRGGVLWHTQGSGKSLTMLCFAGKLAQHSSLENPTIILLTDRIDLDDQLFGTFSRSSDILRQTPVQAKSRPDLRTQLRQRQAGGVIFTTIQKFAPGEDGDDEPTLNDRRNIVVLADEAHRSQYNFASRIDPKTGKETVGLAQRIRDALPSATFVGFTGTPLELEDRDTRLVFGDYIDTYDVQRAVDDGATKIIEYESRLAKLDLDEAETPKLDEGLDELTEDDEVKQQLSTKWSRLEKLVGSQKRLGQIAEDIVKHFEGRLETIDGKGMIVCMSRQVCVGLYNELIKLRPEWHSAADDKGFLKVVITGSASDKEDLQPHVRSKAQREALAKRFKEFDTDQSFKLVIVRDMWLTGFDVPPLHTMYVDKPMKGHSLMQAIARVNRVFRDKPGGLIVDYLGIVSELKKALRLYTESGGRGRAVGGVDDNELVAQMLERLEQARNFFFGFNYDDFINGSSTERLALLPKAQEHILLKNLTEPGFLPRYLDITLALLKAFALASPRDEALAIRDEVVFFQTVRVALGKTTSPTPKTEEAFDHVIRQMVDKAIAPDGVIDIFQAAGLEKPNISILSDSFLMEVRDMPHKNLAIKLLERLINEDIRSRSRKNLILSRAFSDKLREAIQKYHNRSLDALRVIEELIVLAKEINQAHKRGEEKGLSEDELAFYDALEVNDSAVQVMGDTVLQSMARELTETVRQNAKIDWAVRESVKANMRRMVKRLLRKYGYPPDKQDKAIEVVIAQAKLLTEELIVV